MSKPFWGPEIEKRKRVYLKEPVCVLRVGYPNTFGATVRAMLAECGPGMPAILPNEKSGLAGFDTVQVTEYVATHLLCYHPTFKAIRGPIRELLTKLRESGTWKALPEDPIVRELIHRAVTERTDREIQEAIRTGSCERKLFFGDARDFFVDRDNMEWQGQWQVSGQRGFALGQYQPGGPSYSEDEYDPPYLEVKKRVRVLKLDYAWPMSDRRHPHDVFVHHEMPEIAVLDSNILTEDDHLRALKVLDAVEGDSR